MAFRYVNDGLYGWAETATFLRFTKKNNAKNAIKICECGVLWVNGENLPILPNYYYSVI
jgi:hypothetical protein